MKMRYYGDNGELMKPAFAKLERILERKAVLSKKVAMGVATSEDQCELEGLQVDISECCKQLREYE